MVQQMLHGHTPERTKEALRAPHFSNRRKSFDWATDILSGAGWVPHNNIFVQSDERKFPGRSGRGQKTKRDLNRELKEFEEVDNKRSSSGGIGACDDGKDYCEDPRDYPSDDLIRKLNFTSELKFMLLLNSPSDKTVPTTDTRKTNQTKDISDQFSGFRHNIINFSEAISSANTTQGQDITRPRPAKHGRVAGGRARARVPSPPLPRHVAEAPLCATFSRVMFPRYGRTTNDEFRFIYNPRDGSQLRQSIKVKECVAEGERCSGCRGLETACRQQYSHHKLVAFDEEEGATFIESFKFPSGCVCNKIGRGLRPMEV